MAYFKIKNTTNSLNKRHPRYNTTQIIETKNFLDVNKNTIFPGHEIIMESEYLPISAQQLRMKGYIVVQEINKNDYLKYSKTKEVQIISEETSVKQEIIDIDSGKIEKIEERKDKKRRTE